MAGVAVKVSETKMEPMLTLDEKMLPDIKDWKVGEKYYITLEVEQVSMGKGGMMGDGKTMEARFKVLSAEAETPEEVNKEDKAESKNESSSSKSVVEAAKRTLAK